MSTVSPSHGSNQGGGGGGNHSYSNHHTSSTPSHHHQQQSHHTHHSSSQDGPANLSGMPNTSFDSVSSHHGHQQSSQSHSQSHLSQSQPQQPHQQHSNHPPSNSGQWGPSQSIHYGSSGATYPSSHALYNQQGGYYSTQGPAHNNGSSTYSSAGGPYSGYSMQPHQNAYSLYGSHASQGGNTGSLQSAPNGSAHHSGNSTPNSATPYSSHHSHSTNGGMLGVNQGAGAGYYLQSSGAYYTNSGLHGGATTANGVMSQSPSYTSAPQYSTQLPLAGRHRVTTTLWEDEGTLCFQVDARGVCVARRHDNNMINGTKLLNVCGMSRGKRDGILKNEKERVVVKVGAMHLKGVWITFQRGKQLAEQNDIQETLYPLFETNIQSFLYHPDNYPRTAAVIAAAQERQRTRVSIGAQNPNGYPGPQRAASHAGQIGGPQTNPPPLMRSNTTPSGLLLQQQQQGGPMTTTASGYHHHQSNGYSSAPNHHPQHSPYAQSHSVSSAREMPATSGDTDGHMNGRLSGSHVDGGSTNTSRDDVLDDFKMSSTNTGKPPLHSSNLLNSSYGFSTPGSAIKYERGALSDRDTISRSDGMISMPHSDPLWTHRSNNTFHSQ